MKGVFLRTLSVCTLYKIDYFEKKNNVNVETNVKVETADWSLKIQYISLYRELRK